MFDYIEKSGQKDYLIRTCCFFDEDLPKNLAETGAIIINPNDDISLTSFYSHFGFVKPVTAKVSAKEVWPEEYETLDAEHNGDPYDIPEVTVLKSYTVDQEAYDDYISHLTPPTPVAPEPDKITLLEQEVKSLSDRNDFLEDCIAEMATQVYNY